MKESENTALTKPLCSTGTPEELDWDLPTPLREFVVGQTTLSNNLAQIQREREEAEKVAREELKKKLKTVGNGGAKAKTADAKLRDEEKAVAPPAQPPMMSLFDSPAETEVPSGTPSNSQYAEQICNNNNKNNNAARPGCTSACKNSRMSPAAALAPAFIWMARPVPVKITRQCRPAF